MRYDVIVMGAGPAGMIAMARFASAGFRVLGLEKRADLPLDEKDLRSTAFLMPSVRTLEKAGLWTKLSEDATALDVMEIVDAAQQPPKSVAFKAVEIEQEHFGFNILNRHLHKTLRAWLEHSSQVDLRFEVEVNAVMQFEDCVEIRIGTEKVSGRLLVGADGRQSTVRQWADISVETQSFNQMAQVFTITHSLPHNNVSTEVHESGGPFTVVPLSEIDGRPASAVVWMDFPKRVEERERMGKEAFDEIMNTRAHDIRGEMSLASGLGSFPMITLEAERFNRHRIALIAEAAHVVPPIGAQGLNMSLKDIESLVRIAERGALSSPTYLDKWGRQRKMDVTIRKNGIRLLNTVSIGDMSRSEHMRRWGLDVLEQKSPLKSELMRMGLGG